MISVPSSLSTATRAKAGDPDGWQGQIKRVGMVSAGGLCVAVGFVFFLFPPIPIGAPLMAIGFALLMRASGPFKRWLLARTRKLPRIHRFLRKAAGQS